MFSLGQKINDKKKESRFRAEIFRLEIKFTYSRFRSDHSFVAFETFWDQWCPLHVWFPQALHLFIRYNKTVEKKLLSCGLPWLQLVSSGSVRFFLPLLPRWVNNNVFFFLSNGFWAKYRTESNSLRRSYNGKVLQFVYSMVRYLLKVTNCGEKILIVMAETI